MLSIIFLAASSFVLNPPLPVMDIYLPKSLNAPGRAMPLSLSRISDGSMIRSLHFDQIAKVISSEEGRRVRERTISFD